MEKLDMKKVRCQAKVVGTVLTVAGAMLMTLYKGPIVEMLWSKYIHPRKSYVTDTTGTGDKHWFLGSVLLTIATLAWASLFVLQVSGRRAIEKEKQFFFFIFLFSKESKLI